MQFWNDVSLLVVLAIFTYLDKVNVRFALGLVAVVLSTRQVAYSLSDTSAYSLSDASEGISDQSPRQNEVVV